MASESESSFSSSDSILVLSVIGLIVKDGRSHADWKTYNSPVLCWTTL
jgi:hypothetical protein